MPHKKEKSQGKLEQLYSTYKSLMLYTAYQILKDQQLAEDALQIAFLKIINNLEKIEDIYCNKTRKYLVIIVRNVSITMYRRTKPQSESLYSPEDCEHELQQEPLPEDIIVSEESLSQLLESIASLDKKYADVLLLKYAYHYSEAEIAQLLDIKSENVRVRLHRAKKKLRDELERRASHERA